MLYMTFLIAAVLLLAAWIPNEKNAGSLLSGYREMSPAEQAAFPLTAYLRHYKRWMVTLTLLYVASDLLLHFLAPDWRILPIVGLLLGFALFILSLSRRFNQSKKLSLGVALLLALTASLILWGSQSNQTDNPVRITADSIHIQGDYGVEIPFSDLQSWALTDSLPAIRFKRYGYADGDLWKGVFSLQAGGKARLFVRKGEQPYLYLRTKKGEEIYFGLHAATQKELADQLRERLPGF